MASFDKLASLPLQAGETIQAKYLLLQPEELAEYGIEAYLARQKANGRLVWLKLASSAQGAEALEREAQLLHGMDLPHLARLVTAELREERPYLVLQWLGELRLSPERLALLSAPERCRLALQLIATTNALAEMPQQLALPFLQLSQLRVTPGLHYLRLLGLPAAIAGGGHEAMVRGRRAAWECARELLAPESGAGVVELERVAAAWCETGRGALAELEALLQGELVASVAGGF